MALSIDWTNRVIFVSRFDLTLVQAIPTEIRYLDLDLFRRELKSIEGSEGMPYPDTHRHNSEVEFGGITLARSIEIINGYTVTFEDGQYAVTLLGANSNVADVSNVNQVSIRSFNSAGLVSSENSGGGLTPAQIADAVWSALRDNHQNAGSFGDRLGAGLDTINDGVKKASLSVPHNSGLT